MKKIIDWLRRDTGHRYINGGKGVISILLVIVMLPFVYFADLLVEGARYHSAVTLLDEAMDSSSLSVLSDYDKYLYERFGILAVNNNAKISEKYTSYLNGNMGALKSWNFDEITAKGKYALTDNEILIKQIAEFSQYSAPAALVNDLGLGELISTLEKMTKLTSVFDIITGVGKTTDSMITLAESVETLKASAKTFETDRTTYVDKYNAFSNAHSQLVSAVATRDQKAVRVESIESQINSSTEVANLNQSIEKINTELTELEQKKKDGKIKKAEYKKQKEEKEKTLKELEKQLEEAKKANEALYKQLETAKNELITAQSNVNTAKQTLTTAKTEYSSAINTVIGDLNTYQTNADSVMTNIQSCASSAMDLGTTIGTVVAKDELQQNDLTKQKEELDKKIKNTTDEKKKQEYKEAKENIENQINDLDANGNTVEATGTTIKNEVSSYSNDIKDTMSGYNKETLLGYVTKLGEIKTKVDNLNVGGVTASSTLSKSQYYVELNSGFLTEASIQTLINTIENKMSGGSFFDLINAMSTGIRSLFTTNLIFDSRLTAYIAADTGYTPSEIDLILGDFSNLMNLMDTSGDGITGWIKILTRINEIIDALKSLGEHLIAYLTGIMTRAIAVVQDIFSERCGEKLLINEYMVKTLSKRTDMTAEGKVSGTSLLTGYSFANVKFAEQSINSPPVIGDLAAIINLFKDVKEGGSDVMFSGAELEYILTGSRSEIINQSVVFFQIYFIRLIIDAFAIMGNQEVQAIAEAAGAPTFGIGTAVVYIVYVLVEPLIDTLLIVNGNELSLLKSVIYLTPTGLPTLIGRLTKLGVSSENQKSIRTSAEKITGVTATEGGNSNDSKGIKWDYGNYLFVLMLLTIDNKTCIERFRNIVVLESKAYYGKEHFDIGKTYTYIEGKVSGKFDPVLPLGGIVTAGLFNQGRTRMRGY